MRAFFPILLTCCFFACKNRTAEPPPPSLPPLADRLEKTWQLTDYKTLEASIANAERKEKLLTAGILFHFFPDGQWVFVEGEKYHPGKWDLDERNNKIRCTYLDKDSTLVLLFKIRRLTTDTLTADLTRNAQTLSATLENDRRVYQSPEKCPWHPTNNEWRKKPDHAETDQEIKVRAINHLRHYYTLLDAAVANTPHIVSIRNSPSCIQIYNSGIGLRSPEKIDASWYGTFFNRRDADKCLLLYASLMGDQGVLTGPKTSSWMNDDMTLLQRMMNRLQSAE